MNWTQLAEEHQAVGNLVLTQLKQPILDLAEEIAQRLQSGGKVMACGNGGSAADSQHFAGEMVNRFFKERRPYAGLALSTDSSVLTCIGNDYSFDDVFEKQVRALGRKGDVLVGISTSGNSKNICRAVEAAREMGILTVVLVGGKGGKLAAMADRVFSISCTACTPRIQEGHILIIHALCERIEEILQ
jgi:D-sedoheptulose 7-phosphate isomerase